MAVRAKSPPLGSSSLITSAPRKPRSCVQAGPAWLCVMSMTRMPARAGLMLSLPRLIVTNNVYPSLAPTGATCDVVTPRPRAGESDRHPHRLVERAEVLFQNPMPCPTLELLRPGAQVHFKRPGIARLAMDVPIGLGDVIGVHRAVWTESRHALGISFAHALAFGGPS